MSDALSTNSATGGLTRIYDAIEATVPGVQHPIVQLALWDAVEEFCRRSTYWRQTVPFSVVPVAPPSAIALDFSAVDSQTVGIAVLGVTLHCRFQLRPPAGVLLINAQADPVTGTVDGFALVVTKPDQLADTPALLTNQWSEALRDGALARLYAQPGKPYSSPQLGSAHAKKFISHINEARFLSTQFGDTKQWRFPYFSKGRFPGFIGGDGTGMGRGC